MNWDLSQWVPLIKERSFLPWLVQAPPEREVARSLKASSAQLRKLEELWEHGNDGATLPDLDRQELEDEVEPVMVRYSDAAAFTRVFQPLIALESDFDRKAREAQKQKGVAIRWAAGLGGRKRFYFRLNRDIERSSRVVKGDEVVLNYPGDVVNKRWNGDGVVLEITTEDEILVELNGGKNAPIAQTFGFNIDFVWKAVPYTRMKNAVNCFANDDYSVTGFLYHVLLGHEISPQHIAADLPSKVSAPGLPELNKSQEEALRNSMEQPLSLIQGPPGTGKTVTTASIVYHLAQRQRGQVLVCAPSNIGVDHLTAKIHATGLKVVRLTSRSREMVTSFVDFLYLNTLTDTLAKKIDSEVYKLQQLKEMQGELSASDRKRYFRSRLKLEQELLENADVICATCVGAGDPRLRDYRFKQVVIDESTQATEPEVLIPITKGAKQIVLIGDHCQLGPVVMCKKAASAGFDRSLFERLVMLGVRPVRLQIQYRMHPALSEFPSNTFYEGSLQNGVSTEDRKQKTNSNFDWPDPETPTFFYASVGQEEFSASGTSYLNRMEAVNVEKIATKLIKAGVSSEEIGVITPYEGQRQYIVSNMLRTGSLNKTWYDEIEVASVDAFQGREKNYILLSCVRSNENLGVGFLSDPRRLNVALTRAKYGMVIVGNPKVLSSNGLWHSLLSHYKKHHLLVEGPLESLTECFTRLSEPHGHFERKRLWAQHDNEDRDYYRQQADAGGGENGEDDKEHVPEQYSYAHPGEIGPLNIRRSPVVNKKDRARSTKMGAETQFSMSSTQEMSQSQKHSNIGATQDYFSSQTSRGEDNDDSDSAFDSGAMPSQATFADSNGEEEFTQHLQSQRGNQTQPEDQVDALEADFDDLSVGYQSQESTGTSSVSDSEE
ncbi:Regulator of nonsense transcripts 1-like protein [Bonamia ostreae]|uniref:Regulator of nonsense transcripts 1-like protein n=1 Tax=Bonamia ostreae TaxID=126728 RepID=A0ABV2AJC5_9EUKA